MEKHYYHNTIGYFVRIDDNTEDYPLPQGTVEVPKRPDDYATWNGKKWIEGEKPPAFATADDALNTMATWIDQTISALTVKGVPSLEIASWESKARAAENHLNNTATPAQTAMLRTEAAITGEAVDDLAQSIAGKAAAYTQITAAIAGIRRKTEHALKAVTNPHDYETVLNQARNDALSLMANMGLTP